MTENGIADNPGPPLTAQWIIIAGCAAVMGFSLVFIRPPTIFHSGGSVLSPPTWVDRYQAFMMHPLTISAEIVYLWILFAKQRRGWRLVLFAALLGAFLGQLTHKLLAS